MARIGRPPVPAVDRFWSNVDQTGGQVMSAELGPCWPWTGHVDHDGYGVIVVGKNENVRAHRFSFELHERKLAPGEVVRHRCNNPPCVRPSHLRAGTVAQNNEDARRDGRARGQESQVSDVRAHLAARLVAGGASLEFVAARLGVSRHSLARALRRIRRTRR